MPCPAKPTRLPAIIPAAQPTTELKLIRYMGLYDEHLYVGGISEREYRFGLLAKKKMYVDARDLPGFLNLEEDGFKVFEECKP